MQYLADSCSQSETVGGWVNQAYSRLSTTHGHITDCKLDSVVYAGVCVVIQCGPVLFGPNDLPPTVFRCQATDSIPPQVSRNELLRPFILTPSPPVGCLTHYCQAPSWEAQTSHFLRLWCDTVGDRTPASRTPSGRSNHCATQGRLIRIWHSGLYVSYSVDVMIFRCKLVSCPSADVPEACGFTVFGLIPPGKASERKKPRRTLAFCPENLAMQAPGQLTINIHKVGGVFRICV